MSPPKVILISGKQGAGKSSLATLLCILLNGQLEKFAGPLYAMHDAVKGIARSYGIQVAEKEGTLLQVLGTDWARKTKGADVWANAAREKVSAYGRTCKLAVFDDCRFPNELAAFPDALKIRLEAPEATRKARAEGWRDDTSHPSEIALDGAAFDLVFDTSKMGVGEIADRVVEELKRRA